MPLMTAVIVLIFGSLTLIFHDETLIKIKPTALYILFGAALFVGLWLKKPLLKILFDGALHVTDEGWRKLTWRWAFFFLALAVLNEIVWRTQTTDLWVKFKTFGFLPLTLLFALAQAPLIMKYEIEGRGTGRRALMGLTVRCCLGDPHEPLGSNIRLRINLNAAGDETNAPSRERGD